MAAERGVAVVTGAAGSLGRACSEALAARHTVILADVSSDRLAGVATDLARAGHGVASMPCDLTRREEVDALVEYVRSLGPLGPLVHTAGISGAMGSSSEVLAANLVGTLNLLDAFYGTVTDGTVGVMVASGAGHRSFARTYDPVLATATSADGIAQLAECGVLGLHPRAAYAISKRGVILQVERRASSWGHRGGRLLSISPGFLRGSTMGDLIQASGGESMNYAAENSLGRLGTVDDVVRVIEFACSSAADFMTGCDLLVDGGVRAYMTHDADVPTGIHWHAVPSASLRRPQAVDLRAHRAMRFTPFHRGRPGRGSMR